MIFGFDAGHYAEFHLYKLSGEAISRVRTRMAETGITATCREIGTTESTLFAAINGSLVRKDAAARIARWLQP